MQGSARQLLLFGCGLDSPSRLVPVGTLALRANPRLILGVTREPFVLAPLALVDINSFLYLRHTSHYIPKDNIPSSTNSVDRIYTYE